MIGCQGHGVAHEVLLCCVKDPTTHKQQPETAAAPTEWSTTVGPASQSITFYFGLLYCDDFNFILFKCEACVIMSCMPGSDRTQASFSACGKDAVTKFRGLLQIPLSLICMCSLASNSLHAARMKSVSVQPIHTPLSVFTFFVLWVIWVMLCTCSFPCAQRPTRMETQPHMSHTPLSVFTSFVLFVIRVMLCMCSLPCAPTANTDGGTATFGPLAASSGLILPRRPSSAQELPSSSRIMLGGHRYGIKMYTQSQSSITK